MNLAAEEKIDELFLLAAPPAIGFVFANAVLTKARIRVPDLEIQTITKASAWLSSTARWGCGYRCDGNASGLTVGRFNTPDPYAASAGPNDPGSWNRYSYTRGDPINRRDPRGTCDEDTAYSVNVCDTFSLLDLEPVISWPGDGYISGSDVSDQIMTAVNAAIQMAGEIAYAQALGAFTAAAAYIGSGQGLLNSPPCTGDLAAVHTNAGVVQEAANYAVFQNVIVNSTTMASVYAGGVGPAPAGTVGSVMAVSPLGTLALSDAGGNNIYPNGPLISGLLNGVYTIRNSAGAIQPFSVTAILLHELLHSVTGLTDSDHCCPAISRKESVACGSGNSGWESDG